jgi:hypothetical protein
MIWAATRVYLSAEQSNYNATDLHGWGRLAHN